MNEENKPEAPAVPPPADPQQSGQTLMTQPQPVQPAVNHQPQAIDSSQELPPAEPAANKLNDAAVPGTSAAPQSPTIPTATIEPSVSVAKSDNPRIVQLRGVLAKTMLGILVAGAVIAVIAILAGSMGSTAWRAVGTLLAALIHLMVLFGVLSMVSGADDKFRRSNDTLVNVSLAIAALSLFTSVFLIWDVMSSNLASKLYITYLVVMIAVIHAKVLTDVMTVYGKMRYYVYANYFFIAVVALMILGPVYLEAVRDLLSGFYGRMLAASAVVNVTLSAVIAVMHRLYLQKHPELADQVRAKSSGMSAGRLILLALLILFVGLPLLRIAVSLIF